MWQQPAASCSGWGGAVLIQVGLDSRQDWPGAVCGDAFVKACAQMPLL